jgi:benzoyl-CoA 2,3-dioxygenase component B
MGNAQLSSGRIWFDPLARTCRFMLTEEAHHMFVGETGVGRIVQRSAGCRLREAGGPRDCQGIWRDRPTDHRRYLNFLQRDADLFGSDVSSNLLAITPLA